MTQKPTIKEIERGEIMRFLQEMGFRPATTRAILGHMDYMGYALMDDALDFHLRYLADKGLVEIDLFERHLGEIEKIRTVTITAAGVDALDRRRKGDLGVRF